MKDAFSRKGELLSTKGGAWLLTGFLRLILIGVSIVIIGGGILLFTAASGGSDPSLWFRIVFFSVLFAIVYVVVKLPTKPAVSLYKSHRYKAAGLYVLSIFLVIGVSYYVFFYESPEVILARQKHMEAMEKASEGWKRVAKEESERKEKERRERESAAYARRKAMFEKAGKKYKNFVYNYYVGDRGCLRYASVPRGGKEQLFVRNGVQGSLVETATAYELYWPDTVNDCLMFGFDHPTPDQKKEDLMELFDEMIPPEK